MFKYFIRILAILLIGIVSSIAETFKDVEINGNKRISDKSILMFSDIPENKILKNLYNTGFFEDVKINLINNNLVIQVNENPIIQSVIIKGIKAKKITKAIDDVIILKDRSSFNINSAKKDEISILNLFKKLGFYFTKIDTSIEDIGDNKINLIYNIEKGNKSKISKISFTGNKIFKDSKLKSVIISEEYRFWKIISGKNY